MTSQPLPDRSDGVVYRWPDHPGPGSFDRNWRRFSAEFRLDSEAISAEAGERVRALPTMRAVRAPELARHCHDGLSLLVPLVAEGRPQGDLRAHVRESTSAMRDDGIGLAAVLDGWGRFLLTLREWAHQRALRYGADVELAFLDLVLPHITEGMALSAECYRAGAGAPAPTADLSLLVDDVLGGALDDRDCRARCRVHGLDPDGEYRAVHASRLGEHGPQRVANWLEVGPAHPGAVVARDGTVRGFVTHVPRSAIGHPVGFSHPVRLEQLPTAFRHATRALTTAMALDLHGPHSIGSLGAYPAVVDDREVGVGLRQRYVQPLRAEGAPGMEILATVRAYLAANRHTGDTASVLFVHPNTVRYRIRRFETLTGVSLGDTRAIIDVWWALEHDELVDVRDADTLDADLVVPQHNDVPPITAPRDIVPGDR